VSVGGAFALVVYGAACDAAQELMAQGTYGFAEGSSAGAKARAAFSA
jgi:hypothetical protein